MWRLLIQMNLFKSSIRREPTDIIHQRWTSRIYILCLCFGVAILTFYAMLNVQKKTVEVGKLPLKTVLSLQLEEAFNASLQCPCAQINMPYGKVLELQPHYHQICASDFVSEFWLYNIRALLQVNTNISLDRLDFRHSYQSFYLLKYLCDLIHRTIIASIEAFAQTQLVTSYLRPPDLFEKQMISAIERFQSEVVTSFTRFFQLTRNDTHINQYFSDANIGLFEITEDCTTSFSIGTYHTLNDNLFRSCSCANDISCKSQLGLFNQEYISIPARLVPGLYRACSSFESLFHSTLECFYDDHSCLAEITTFYNEDWFPTNFTLLNTSLPTRFAIGSPLGTLLSELFIEEWRQSVSYSSYFTLCQPISCSYEILRSNSVLETTTLVLGLVGGLSVSLRILIPLFATLYIDFNRGRRERRTSYQVCEFYPPTAPPFMHSSYNTTPFCF